jgi:hypothetical protein
MRPTIRIAQRACEAAKARQVRHRQAHFWPRTAKRRDAPE